MIWTVFPIISAISGAFLFPASQYEAKEWAHDVLVPDARISRSFLVGVEDEGHPFDFAQGRLLRGCEKLTKRQMSGAMTYNLSLPRRTLFGTGTPKPAMAGVRGWLSGANDQFLQVVRRLIRHFEAFLRLLAGYFFLVTKSRPLPTAIWGFSTGC